MMNKAQFQEAMKNDKPVLVEFMAPWCVYCRRIAPAMELIAKEQADTLQVGFVDIDQEPELAGQEAIELVPTLIVYENGKQMGRVVAPGSKAQIEEFIRETLGK